MIATKTFPPKRAAKTLRDLTQFSKVFLRHTNAGHGYKDVAEELGVQFNSVINRVLYLRHNGVTLDRDTKPAVAIASLNKQWASKNWKSYRDLKLSMPSK
jgi:hypothetical protein